MACTVLCACVVPCVRVLCARALLHTRGYTCTHLISANGFGCDARGNCAQKELSSIVKFAARGGRIPGLKHRGEPGTNPPSWGGVHSQWFISKAVREAEFKKAFRRQIFS